MEPHAAVDDAPGLDRCQQLGLLIGGGGVLAGVIGGFLDRSAGETLLFGLSPQFFRAWLIGFLFCLGLSVGSLALLMLQHLSGGQWGLVSRRVFEAAAGNMWLVALFFLPVLLGIPMIFEWSHAEVVEANSIVAAKAPYLNVRFFLVRAVIYFAFWLLCTWLLNSWSAGQDRGTVATTEADSVRFRKVSAPGLLFLVLTVTFASVDWVMSLEPEWFSTIFGLLLVVGQGLSALSLAILVLALVADSRAMSGTLVPRHFHDLGKVLLTFVMLWAYLAFSQFLIIWSGNLPEEIPWYLKRMQGTWGAVALLLVLGHFALPFLLLLSRDLKRHSGLLSKVALAVLVMRLVDLIWLVAPAFAVEDGGFHWLYVVLPVGLAGVWMAVFVRTLRSRALLPRNDPYFKEIFAHEAH
jgi:hypothetical protein